MSEQFSVYVNESSAARERPVLVVMQADLLETSDLIICAPAVPATRWKAVTGIHPTVVLGDVEFCVIVDELGVVPRGRLKKRIGNLAAEREKLLRAVDLLFFGI